MTTSRHLKQALAKMGASLDEDNSDQSYLMDAPPGMVWCASGSHCYVVPFKNHGQPWRREALADAAAVLARCDAVHRGGLRYVQRGGYHS